MYLSLSYVRYSTPLRVEQMTEIMEIKAVWSFWFTIFNNSIRSLYSLAS